MDREVRLIGAPFAFKYPSGRMTKKVRAICYCGKEWDTNYYHFKAGNVKSCGCGTLETKKDKAKQLGYYDNGKTTHGLSGHPLYYIWSLMRQRCQQPKCRAYRWYGKKGVSVCQEWDNDFMVFYDWCMANGWEKGLHVDRFPNCRGNYEPTNCRITTAKNNMRNTTRQVNVRYKGQTKNLMEWAEVLGKSYRLLYGRIVVKGMTMKEALNYKPKPVGRKPLPIINKSFHIKVKRHLKERGIKQRWLTSKLIINGLKISDYKISEKLNGNSPFTQEEITNINEILQTKY